MKTRMYFLTSLVVLLLGMSFLFPSCNEDPVTATPTEQTPPAPDSIADLIAFFHSGRGVLLVAPGYEAQVLDYLGVHPSSDGRFILVEINAWGETRSYVFLLQIAPQDQIFLAAKDAEKEPLLEETGEEDGVRFKIYKNADCPEKPNQKKEKGDWENLPQIDPVTEAASYQSEVEETYTKCIWNKNPNNRCKEYLKKVGTTTYNDKFNGKGNTVKTEDYKRFRCN